MSLKLNYQTICSRIKNFPLFLFLLFTGFVTAQDGEMTASQRAKMEAREHIQKMKGGIVLVRLESQNAQIKSFRDKGYENDAKALEDKMKAQQKEVIEAIESEMDFFGEVYYFYGHHTAEIEKMNYKGFLMDENMKQVTLEKGGVLYLMDTENIPAGEMGSAISGYSLMNKNGELLNSPFPYYMRRYSAFFKRSEKRIAKKLNDKLKAFYEKE